MNRPLITTTHSNSSAKKMNKYTPDYAIKKRRMAAVTKALNTPNLPTDMRVYWQGVLTHLKRSKNMMTTKKPEIVLQQLQQGMEEIIFLLEEILRTLNKSADPKAQTNITSLSDRTDNKHH